MPSTFFNFRRWTTFALSVILFFAVFAFGATDPWAFPVVAAGVLGVSAFWAVRMLRSPYPVVLTWFYAPVAIVPAVGAVQMLLGRTASRYRTGGELAWWIVYLVFFFLFVNVLEDISLRRTVQRRLAYLGGLVSALAIVQWLLSPRAAYGLRLAPGSQIFGPFADTENFVFLIELLFPGALFLAFRDSGRKLSLFLCCTVMVAAIALSGSVLGQVAVAGEFFLALAVSSYLAARSLRLQSTWRPQALIAFLGAIAIAAVVVVGFGADQIRGRLGLGLDPLQTPGLFVLTRKDVFDTSRRLFEQRPVLGQGLGAFGAVFPSAVPRRDGFHWEHAYTDPVELAVELGALGILVQALLLVMMVGRRRSSRTWVSVILPLAVFWAHSWVRSPLRTPALVLTALTLLALLPASGAVPSLSRSRPDEQEG